jgi:hypothetical protein
MNSTPESIVRNRIARDAHRSRNGENLHAAAPRGMLYAKGYGQTLTVTSCAFPHHAGIEVNELSPVVAAANLGRNNCENMFGWSGNKYVVHFDRRLVLLDWPDELYHLICGELVLIGEGVGVDYDLCAVLDIPTLDLRTSPAPERPAR